MARNGRGSANQLHFPADFIVDFDADAFDEIVENKGVTVVHWRAMPCPVGLLSKFDARKPHDDHEGCSNGYVYTKAGEIDAVFTGNSTQMLAFDIGLLTGSSAQVSFPRYYNAEREGLEPEPFFVSTFDRFYLPDPSILVVATQMFEVSGRPTDRMRYPIVKVIDLMDSAGNRYALGDYAVTDGKLQWLTPSRPTFDAGKNQGAVCSIRYLYRPYWYFKQHLHELRVSQAEGLDGERATTRLPQAGILQRENVFESEDADPDAKDPKSPRQAQAPARQGLGPR